MSSPTTTPDEAKEKEDFFKNPYDDYEFGFTFGTDNASLKGKILAMLDNIVTESELGNEEACCDGGLYTGLGGIAYMFLHCLRQPDILTPAERVQYTGPIFKFLNLQLRYYCRTREVSQREGDDSQSVGFLVGDSGVYAVGAALAKAVGNCELQIQCVAQFVRGAVVARQPVFHPLGNDDLFYGRAGYLCAALWLNQSLGYMPVPKEDLFTIWKLIIANGRENAESLNCKYPLAFTYNDSQYIGTAHGLSSILQVLLSWPQFLVADPDAEKDIKTTLDYFYSAIFQGSSATEWLIPKLMEDMEYGKTNPKARAEWASGVSGLIYLFAKAGYHYKSHGYMKGCLKCADWIWANGLVKTGPGLAYGIAGNAYVFLLLYRLTEQDPKYLYRALRFAEFMFSEQFLEESEVPEHPYSLFNGLAGTVCFLSDLIRPAMAEFPFFNIFYEPDFGTQAEVGGVPPNIPALLPISSPVNVPPPPLKARPNLTPSPPMSHRARARADAQVIKKRRPPKMYASKVRSKSTKAEVSYSEYSNDEDGSFCAGDLLEMEINEKEGAVDIN